MTIGWASKRQGADIQSKVEELNQSMRNRDKMKEEDDAIAQLSDQLMALRIVSTWHICVTIIGNMFILYSYTLGVKQYLW